MVDTGELNVEQTRRRLLISVSVFANILFAVTWRLWLPVGENNWTQTHCHFPRVPLLGLAANIPLFVDYFLFGLAIIATGVTLASKKPQAQRLALIGFVFAASCLVSTNQHRLQPWLYQFAILSVFAVVLPAQGFTRFARLLLISIYLFSAWSKFDYAFLHSLGQQFVDVLLSPLGGFNERLAPTTRTYLALIFPIGELIVAVGLWYRKTRRPAAMLAVALHVALIGILGPWGLGHHLGVLIWNAFFISLIWILFLDKHASQESPTNSASPESTNRLTHYAATAVLFLPLLEPLGFFDHWPAWQLYAPRNRRVTMQIVGQRPQSLKNVPQELLPFIKGNESGLFSYVDMDAWSLKKLGVPNYPQDRFQLGVALAIAKNCKLDSSVSVSIQSVSNRTTGKRKQKTLRGTDEIEKAAHQFNLNAIPNTKAEQ